MRPKKPDPTARCLPLTYFPEYDLQVRKAFEAVIVNDPWAKDRALPPFNRFQLGLNFDRI